VFADLVVDTNVLVHAENVESGYHEPSLALLEALEGGTITAICVDAGFDPEEAKNKSAIYSEYLRFLGPQTYPMVLIARLAAWGRLDLLDRPPVSTKNVVRRLVPGDMIDRRFLEIASVATAKTLVSHDYEDFHVECRERAANVLGVAIVEAVDVITQVA
jgi:hypothetical protein